MTPAGRSTAWSRAPTRSPVPGARGPGPRRRSARSGRSSACSASAGSMPPGARWPAPRSTAGWPATRARSAAGIALPFAMALLEYDLEPQQLAIDIASGAIDLALESELLREHDRRAVAEAEAARLAGRGHRADRRPADRAARDHRRCSARPTRPWLGVTLREPDVDAALEEATSLDRRRHRPHPDRGPDRARAGRPDDRRRPRTSRTGSRARRGERVTEPDLSEAAPTGSQRALDPSPARGRSGRRAAPRVCPAGDRRRRPSERRRARSWPPSSGSTCIASDAMAEIVANAVEPDRALADHAFAHRLARRAGTSILVGSGPLVVAPGPVGRRAVRPRHPRRSGARAPAPRRHAGARRRPRAGPDHRRRPAALADRRAGARPPARSPRSPVRRAALPGPSARVRRAADRSRSIGPVAVRPGRGRGPCRRHRARPARRRFRPR